MDRTLPKHLPTSVLVLALPWYVDGPNSIGYCRYFKRDLADELLNRASTELSPAQRVRVLAVVRENYVVN